MNVAASLPGKSLNAWVSEQLQSAVAQTGINGPKKARTMKKNRHGKVGKPRSET